MVVENIRRPGQLLNNAWNELAMIDRAKVIQWHAERIQFNKYLKSATHKCSRICIVSILVIIHSIESRCAKIQFFS